MKAEFLLKEHVFLNRSIYQEAERHYSLRKNVADVTNSHAVHTEVNKIKEQIKSGLSDDTIKVADLVKRLSEVELENKTLKTQLQTLEARLTQLEGGKPATATKPAPAPAPAKKEEKADDDFDLFDDEVDEEAERIKQERIDAYNQKKVKKTAVAAKSSVLLDVKPWDDETNMKDLEKAVRGIEMDGLVWGTSKLVPVAFGVKKLQIQCVIEDDKVSTEALEEQICAFEDYVQSVDIAAFNKI